MYDGLTDPLGQSQVLSYLKHLSKDYSFDVIGYEKPEVFKGASDRINKEIAGLDIKWLPIKYHKNPPIISTIYDLYMGRKIALKNGHLQNYDLIHCRSAAIGAVALSLKKIFGAKLLFDMRGWWADEKKDSGAWNSIIYQPIYSYFKNLEKELFKYCHHSISFTTDEAGHLARLKFEMDKKLSYVGPHVDGRQEDTILINTKT